MSKLLRLFIYRYVAPGVVRSSHVFGVLNRLHQLDSESSALRRSKSGKPLTYSGKLIHDFGIPNIVLAESFTWNGLQHFEPTKC